MAIPGFLSIHDNLESIFSIRATHNVSKSVFYLWNVCEVWEKGTQVFFHVGFLENRMMLKRGNNYFMPVKRNLRFWSGYDWWSLYVVMSLIFWLMDGLWRNLNNSVGFNFEEFMGILLNFGLLKFFLCAFVIFLKENWMIVDFYWIF